MNQISEKIMMAEVFKQNGIIHISFPNNKDVCAYELFGFLKCYMKEFEKDLIDNLKEEDDNYD